MVTCSQGPYSPKTGVWLLLLLLVILAHLSEVTESRWLAGGRGRHRLTHNPHQGSGGGGPRPWRTSDPGTRGRDVCPTRHCRCQRRLGLWHLHCTLPLAAMPRFRSSSNITLETATIARRNLTKVPGDAFRGIVVHHLDLSGNLLSEGLHGGAFRGLGEHLRSLSLANCRLLKVPTAALEKASSLRVLHLEYNDIRTLRAGSFRGLHQLRDLSIYGNRIIKIDRGALLGLGTLDKLRLSHNDLSQFRRKMLTGASNITSLDVSDNRIQQLGSGAFRDIHRLKWLELGGNQISDLSRGSFRGLRNLKYLKLDRNPLVRIGDRTFATSRRLRYLSLDIGNVSTVTNMTFKGLGQLKTFYVGEVNRAGLPDGVFADARRLKFLSMSDYNGLFNGLEHCHFTSSNASGGDQVKLRELSIWIVPIHQCHCHTPWILDITGRGAYVHGYCQDGTPISCRRRHRRKGFKSRRRGKEA